jgi:flagellum-specific ATP synthase
LLREAKRLLAAYDDMAEMIRLGAYRQGSDQTVDRAIALQPELQAFLNQGLHERDGSAEAFARLAAILDQP